MFYAAIIMGLAGSLHCAGMCSPLVMAATAHKPFVISKIVYNTGRILVYAALGAVAAGAGSFFELGTYQRVVSISLGVIFLLVGVGALTGRHVPFLRVPVEQAVGLLRKGFSYVLHRSSFLSLLLAGAINGLLPCGLTYLALSACLLLPSAVDGVLFMLLFGMGTWPVMVGFAWLLRRPIIQNKFSTVRFSRWALVIMGCLLLARVWWPHSHPATLPNAKPLGAITTCE